ncbi:glycerophosphodiester phosphodiesterase domain-containing protein 5-like isoform X2 [Ptychodera flava]|uniref:glycerophosphodiester phosphodiesterase domain-containing protein 5-like isoform X2 n=1 Tax=Ptychodera flava TaxID=63121 RepID=UPI00396A0438
MVSHLRLENRQRYEQQICLSCVTGLYGCRWKRYQRSTSDTSLVERIWFFFTVLAFSFMVFWLYFWLVVRNDWDDINWFLYDNLGFWFDWFFLFLILTCIVFSYAVILMVLALCHIIAGQEIYLHWSHKVLVVLILLASTATIIIFCEVYPEEWVLVRLSLLVFAPFLQMFAVVLLTALTWLIAGAWAKLRKIFVKVNCLIIYVAILVFLYLCPLLMNSPCIANFENLPEKPLLVGHRGAMEIAPENTLISFQKAVENKVHGFESDVRISADGVPFLLHDETLLRTTNVETVFPSRKNEPGTSFNISDLKKLDAGSWYLEQDPFRKASSISAEDREKFRNQTILTYVEWLQYAADTKKIIIFDLFQPPRNHSYRETFLDLVLNLTLESNINHTKVWWLSERERAKVISVAPDFIQVSEKKPLEELQESDIEIVNEGFYAINEAEIRNFENYNISTNIYIVNSKWLYSLYWCVSVPTVTSSKCEALSKINSPIYHMKPDVHLIIWITLDAVSAVIVVVIFVVQRLRHRHLEFTPEVINLNSPRRIISGSKKGDEKLVLAPNENPEDMEMHHGESRNSVNTADLPNGELSTDESLESLPTLNHQEIRVEMG